MQRSVTEFLRPRDIKVEEIFVEEWGGNVRLKVMSGKERDEFETISMSRLKKNGDMDITDMRDILLLKVIVDANDQLMFTKEDIPVLSA